MKRRKLVTTSNYWATLDFVLEWNEPASRELLASLELLTSSFKTLRQLPDVGRPFRGPRDALVKRVIERLGGGELREFVAGELLVLYLSGPTQVSLLAVRHQKQSGYLFN